MKQSIRLITTTAMLIALVVIVQLVFALLGQFVVGPLVNLILMIAALNLNWRSGLLIGFISPFFAFLLNIGTPLFVLVPWIAMGNVLLVATIIFVHRARWTVPLPRQLAIVISLLLGVFIKVAFYWMGIVGFLLPTLDIPINVRDTLSYSFSWMQLFTGLIAVGLLLPVQMLLQPTLRRFHHD